MCVNNLWQKATASDLYRGLSQAWYLVPWPWCTIPVSEHAFGYGFAVFVLVIIWVSLCRYNWVNLIIKVLFCLFFQLFFDNTDLGNTVTLIIKFTTYNCILEVNYFSIIYFQNTVIYIIRKRPQMVCECPQGICIFHASVVKLGKRLSWVYKAQWWRCNPCNRRLQYSSSCAIGSKVFHAISFVFCGLEERIRFCILVTSHSNPHNWKKTKRLRLSNCRGF